MPVPAPLARVDLAAAVAVRGSRGDCQVGFDHFTYDPSSPEFAPDPKKGQYLGASPPGFGVEFGFATAFATAICDGGVPGLGDARPDRVVPRARGLHVDGRFRPGADLYLQSCDSTATVFASDALSPAALTIVDVGSSIGRSRQDACGERIQFQVNLADDVPVASGIGGILR